MTISRDKDRLTIIIPKEMKKQLKEIAKSHNRSLSNYIVNVLSEQINKEKKYFIREKHDHIPLVAEREDETYGYK